MKKSTVFNLIRAATVMLSIITITLTGSAYADVPGSTETMINPGPDEIHYVNELLPNYSFSSSENNFRRFRLTDFTSVDVSRSGAAGSYKPYWEVKSSGQSNNWLADFSIGYGNMRDQVEKGDLEIMVVFDAQNKKRASVFLEDDYINFQMFNNGSPYPVISKQMFGDSSPELMHNGWKNDISTGWIHIGKTVTSTKLRFYSSNGEKDNNDTAVKNIRVYFKDKQGPVVNAIEAVPGTYKDRVDFKLVFDEPVKLNGTTPGNIKIVDGSGNEVGWAVFDGMDETDSRKLKYHMDIQPNTEIRGLNASIPASPYTGSGSHLFSAVTDMAGNFYSGTKVGSNASSGGTSNGLLSVTIDNKPPSIKSVDIPNAPDTFKLGSRVAVNVEFSEKIVWNSNVNTTLAMNNGGIAGGDNTKVRVIPGNILQFDYIVDEDDSSIDRLDIKTNKQLVGENTIWTAELVGEIKDTGGNPVQDTVSGNSVIDIAVPVLDAESGKATTCQAEVDITPPYVSIVLDNYGWAKTHTATVKLSDSGSGGDTFDFRIWGNTKYRVLSIDGVPQVNPEYKFLDFSTLPAAEKGIAIEFETSEGGEFLLQIIYMDKAGNFCYAVSDKMKFDRAAPSVSFENNENDPGKVKVEIKDESGFDLSDIEMQWVDCSERPDEGGWSLLDAGGGTYGPGAIYTSHTLVMPVEDGKLNQKRLFIRTKDVFENSTVVYSQVIIEDKTDPQYNLYMPSTEEYMPYFSSLYAYGAGTVTDAVYTELTYKWVKPEINPDTVAWVSDADVPVALDQGEHRNYLSRHSAQRYFNNGELFNGTWNLYLKAVYHGIGGAEKTSYPGPFSYNFDNTVASIEVDGGDDKPCREKDINVEIRKFYKGEEFPDFPISGIYYFWGRGEVNQPILPPNYGEEYAKVYPKEKNFTVKAVNLPETGLYRLNIFDSRNDYKTVTESVYIDYHSPRGYMDIAEDTSELTDIGFKLSAIDLTVGRKGSLEYSISLDEGDWSPWTPMDGIYAVYGGGTQPTQEEEDIARQNGASFYSSHQFPGTLDLPNSIEGPHTVCLKLRDAAGNESDVYSYVIYYDRTKPTGTLKYSATSPTNQNVKVIFEAVKDNISLPENIMAYDADSPTPGWVPWNKWDHEFIENGEQEVKIKDAAGNETVIIAKVDWIDKTSPAMTTRKLEDPYYGKVMYYGKYFIVDVTAYDPAEGGNVPAKLSYCLRRYETSPEEDYYDPEDPDNVWKEAVPMSSPAEEVVIEEIDGVTHYLLKFYNYNQDDSDIVGENPNAKRHILLLKAEDEVGNYTYYFSDAAGNIYDYMEHRLLADGDIIYAMATYTPAGGARTAGPVKVDLVFDTPVVIVPMEGEYVLPVDLNEYRINHTVYTSENGPMPLRVVNRFGGEVIVPNAIYVEGIDNSLKTKVTLSPEGWTRADSVTVTVEAGAGQLIYDCSGPSGISEHIGSEGGTSFNLEGRTFTGYKKVTYSFRENGTLDYKVYNTEMGANGVGQAVVDKIDRTPPTGQIAYDFGSMYDETGEATNTGYVKAYLYNLSDASGSTVTAINEGGAVHIFTENRSFDFIIRDEAGNTTTLTAVVNGINKSDTKETNKPTVDVNFWIETLGGPESYDASEWTNTSVHAVIAPKDESAVRITNNEGNNEYVFAENGSFTFNLEDEWGNTADITVTVDKIDRIPPEGNIIYNQDNNSTDVKAALKVSDNNGVVNIVNTSGVDGPDGEGRYYHIFTSTGSFIFYVQDIARNTSSFKAQANIDGEEPECKVYGMPSKPTNRDVKLTIDVNEAIRDAYFVGAVPSGASISRGSQRVNVVFAENGSATVRVEDLKGNYTDVPLTVDKIDKEPPIGRVELDESKKLTERIVTARIVGLSDNMSTADKIRVLNNNSLMTKVFDSNGTYTFIIADEAGNQKELPVTIAGIDRTPPELSLSYSATEKWVKGPVTVELSCKDDSAVTILNNNGSNRIVFTQNGAFTFLVQDASGNKASIMARVENIDSEAPVITFENNDPWLAFLQGGEFSLDDYTAYDNIDGDVTESVNIRYNGFDINKPGEYTVMYTAVDKVGNMAQASRRVKVVSKDDLRIFVNGQEVAAKTIITNGPTIKLQIMNTKGETAAWWKKGKYPLGSMKSGGSVIAGDSFKADALGWYTILVQDQERNSYLIPVYVSSMAD